MLLEPAAFRGVDGTRYAKVSSQPCWTIVETAGRRPSDGAMVDSSALLPADGRAGRYWPGPALKDPRTGERVGGRLEPLTPSSLILGADDGRWRATSGTPSCGTSEGVRPGPGKT